MKRKGLLKTLLLLCALVAGGGSVWADTFTITRNSFTDAQSSYGTYSWTVDGVSGKGQIYGTTTASMQMNGGNANGKIIYNTTAVPGSIAKINLIKASGSNRSYSVYGRTTAYSGTGDYGTLIATANIQDGTGRDYTVTSGDYNYFVVVNNTSNAAYLASVTVETVVKNTLSSAVLPVESGTVSLGATKIAENKTTTITATPNEGYRFVNWSVSGTGASVASATNASTTFTMGTTDATVTANFELIPSHDLSYVVSPVGAGSVILGSSSVLEDATTTATASANAGYKFTGWSISGTGSSLSNTTDNPVTITMGTANAIITANFTEVTTYPIHWSVNGTVVKTDNVEENTAISFAAPESGVPTGYVFRGWVAEANKISGTTNTDPKANYVTSANSTEEVTYYAVMAVITAEGDDTYEKLESDTFDPKATYVIAGNQSSTSDVIWYLNSYNNVDEDCSWGVATTTPATVAPVTFTLSGTATALVATDNSGNYLTCITVKQFAMSSTSTTVYLDDDGSIKSASDGNLLRYNYNTGNGGFRWYASTTGTQAYFYKVVSNKTYGNYCTTVPTATITLQSACTDGSKYYGTYSNSSAFVVPSDLTVSEIKVVEGKLALSNYTAGEIVPANTGVMVASSTAGEHTVTIAAGGTSKLGSDNMLKPSGDAGITAANMTAADTKFYRLTMHNGTTIGFWWGAASGAAFDLTANKAYLAVPDVVSVREGFTFGDETNGISLTTNFSQKGEESVYTLSGQKVAQPTKGLYIVNGKKMFVK